MSERRASREPVKPEKPHGRRGSASLYAPLSHVLYRSETELQPDSSGAWDLVSRARQRNATLHLTGLLHLEEGFFFQWLEGPEDGLGEVLRDIECDDRHCNMTYLKRGAAWERQFPDWDMHMSTRNDASIFFWLSRNPVSQYMRREYAATILTFLQSRRDEAN